MADPIRQLLSQTSWVANGTDTVWNFSFEGGYIDRTHVKAQRLSPTGGQTIIEVTPGMFVGPYQLQILPPVPAGHELTIFRDSLNGGLPLVDFSDRANLTEAALDLMAKQAIFVAAESADGLNVAVDSVSQIVQYTEAATAAAAASQASAVASAASATQSATYRDQSATHSTTAQSWAANAQGHANASANSAVQSANSAAAAAASAASIEGGPVTSVAGLTGVVGTGPLKVAIGLDFLTNHRQVQNGTGVSQNPGNTVKIGFDGARVRMTVDATDFGQIANTQDLNTKLNLAGGVMTGPLYVRPGTGAGFVSLSQAQPTDPVYITFSSGPAGSYAARWAMQMDGTAGVDFALHRYAGDGGYLGYAYTVNNATGVFRFGSANVHAAMVITQDASTAAVNADTGNAALTFLSELGAVPKTCYIIGGSANQTIQWLIQNSAGGTYPAMAGTYGVVVSGAFDRRAGAINMVTGLLISGTWWLTVIAMSP